MKDPTQWIEDLTVFLDDEELAEMAATIEPTLVYGGSKALAGAWVGLAGVPAGALGAVTLGPELRQSWLAFAGYLVAAVVLLRVLHPLTVRLMARAVAWLTAVAMFWAFFLGFFAVLGARFDSTTWAYVTSGGAGAFIGLMYGSLNPGVVRREDAWLLTALPLAPASCVLATYLFRKMGDPGLLGFALSGAIAGGLFMIPMSALLAWVWDEAHGLRQMGVLYLHNDNFALKAVAYLDRAIALEPRDAALYNLRGIAWSKAGEPHRASADWRTVADLLPGDPNPHLNRGVDFLRQNMLEPAVEALQTALAIAPGDPKVHSNLGVAYERQGNLDRAIDHYTKAIAADPDYANAYSNRGYAHFRKGDYMRALEDCERAPDLAPEFGMAAVNRGHVLAALVRMERPAPIRSTWVTLRVGDSQTQSHMRRSRS